jgi:Anti-sigma factor NepR
MSPIACGDYGAKRVPKMTDKSGDQNTGKSGDQNKVKKMRTDSAFDPVEAALRQLYDQVAAEKIPDDFLNLLDRLEAHDKKAGPK